jgi:hypothetical protein
LDRDKTPKVLDKASEKVDKVSKETFLASEEARKGGGGRKNEIEKKWGRRKLFHGCQVRDWKIFEVERRERFAL